jgi:vancomycin resistance protein VanW
VLDDGRLTEGIGGGLCQLTNLLYWMTLHTPLTVVERWRHNHDVFPDAGRTQPFGSGATCAWPVLDLQFENRTDIALRLAVRTTATDLVGGWTTPVRVPLRYEVYEVAHATTNDPPGVFGRRNVLRRRTFDTSGSSDVEVGDEFVTANEARLRYAPFLAAGGAGGGRTGGEEGGC